jgi:hypothetical protein
VGGKEEAGIIHMDITKHNISDTCHITSAFFLLAKWTENKKSVNTIDTSL